MKINMSIGVNIVMHMFSNLLSTVDDARDAQLTLIIIVHGSIIVLVQITIEISFILLLLLLYGALFK
jgi:hypothetical protein